MTGSMDRLRRVAEDMMALQPWYKIVEPRENLREDHLLNALDCAVHFDNVPDVLLRTTTGPTLMRIAGLTAS